MTRQTEHVQGPAVRSRRRTVGGFALAMAVLLGMLAGIGSFTFGYANGLSYFSTDPQACANCHIMQDYYDTWQKSSHHHVAGCVDCHLPHDFVRKYIAKADNGFFHSTAFTLDNFHEPIRIKARNRRIAQDNCMQCHEETVHQMLPSGRGAAADDGPRDETPQCIRCHAGVGHGPR